MHATKAEASKGDYSPPPLPPTKRQHSNDATSHRIKMRNRTSIGSFNNSAFPFPFRLLPDVLVVLVEGSFISVLLAAILPENALGIDGVMGVSINLDANKLNGTGYDGGRNKYPGSTCCLNSSQTALT